MIDWTEYKREARNKAAKAAKDALRVAEGIALRTRQVEALENIASQLTQLNLNDMNRPVRP